MVENKRALKYTRARKIVAYPPSFACVRVFRPLSYKAVVREKTPVVVSCKEGYAYTTLLAKMTFRVNRVLYFYAFLITQP